MEICSGLRLLAEIKGGMRGLLEKMGVLVKMCQYYD